MFPVLRITSAMTCRRVLVLCLLCLGSVGSVPVVILAGRNDGVPPPVGEQDMVAPPSSGLDLTALSATHRTAGAPPLSNRTASGLFERYIAGLGRLAVALRNPEYDWEARAHASSPVAETVHHGTANFKDEIQKIFALAGTMKGLKHAMEQRRFDYGDTELQNDETTDGHVMFPFKAEAESSSRLRTALIDAITNLSRLFGRYFWQQSGAGEDIKKDAGEKENGMQDLVKALEALAEAHTNYTVAINDEGIPVAANRSAFVTSGIPKSSTSAGTEDSVWRRLSWHENQKGLQQVVAQLKTLLESEPQGSDRNNTVLAAKTSTMPFTINTSTTTTTTTTTTTVIKPRKQPCLSPFELIAYRMCILQEMHLKLSWTDAQTFCRDRGAELAEDMVVIKTRRYLDDLYGEYGTRSRWPVWVGGRRDELSWRWAGGLEVPGFLWAPEEPRVYSSHLVPEGLCMVLDGYRRFYGASLPCHLRRRFVCQLPD